mmetsp:Transcript_24008/g.44069  ORF Transcript_24008/g.44069 Transcript_24008/m.44069 type:complete len:207 (-) Transcript_24008:7087-7707(-)
MAAAQDGEANHMGRVFACRRYDLVGCEADAFIGDIHAAVTGPHGNLLGTVRVTVQSRFADQKFQAAAQPVADRIDRIAQIVQSFGHVGLTRADTRWAPIFAMDCAHLCGPLACGDAGAGGHDRGGHDIVARSSSGAQVCQGGIDRCGIPCVPPRIQSVNLLLLNRRVHHHDPAISGHQWGGFTRLVFVHANDDRFTTLNPAQTFRV